jgi:hypothetical protein
MQDHALVECWPQGSTSSQTRMRWREPVPRVGQEPAGASNLAIPRHCGLSAHNSGATLPSEGFRGRSQCFTLPLVGEDRTKTGRHRVSVAEAARILNTTAEAIRSRIKRGTLPSTKESGRVYVLLSPDQIPLGQRPGTAQTTDQSQSAPDALISEMRGRIEDLRIQLESERAAHAEARRLLAAAMERIPPQLEAPSEPRESPEPATAGPVEPTPSEPTEGPQEGAEPRSWWRRMFGG